MIGILLYSRIILTNMVWFILYNTIEYVEYDTNYEPVYRTRKNSYKIIMKW